MLIHFGKPHFIFVHIPKTAGRSITRWLSRAFGISSYGWQEHATIDSVYRVVSPNFFRRAYKFSFVRNPWDRLVSQYKWVLDRPQDTRYKRYCNPHDLVHPKVGLPSQRYYITKDGKVMLDFVGKFENLAEDVAVIAEKLGIKATLPHLNTSLHEHYSRYYTQEMIELVGKKYAWEVKQFGYNFECA